MQSKACRRPQSALRCASTLGTSHCRARGFARASSPMIRHSHARAAIRENGQQTSRASGVYEQNNDCHHREPVRCTLDVGKASVQRLAWAIFSTYHGCQPLTAQTLCQLPFHPALCLDQQADRISHQRRINGHLPIPRTATIRARAMRFIHMPTPATCRTTGIFPPLKSAPRHFARLALIQLSKPHQLCRQHQHDIPNLHRRWRIQKSINRKTQGVTPTSQAMSDHHVNRPLLPREIP